MKASDIFLACWLPVCNVHNQCQVLGSGGSIHNHNGFVIDEYLWHTLDENALSDRETLSICWYRHPLAREPAQPSTQADLDLLVRHLGQEQNCQISRVLVI